MASVDYASILAEAWQQHIAPKLQGSPTVISTFAGCGGSSLGYSCAGFRELLAVEWNQNAVDTFRLNFPDVPVYHGDINALSVAQVLEETGLQEGELTVFDGSPPCQGFSTAGRRIIDDPRNQLFREYVRLLRGLQPKAFVMENVSGMVKGKMKLVFAEIMQELKASGYKVSARRLTASYFHVPQHRERMIFIGIRNDIPVLPSHPTALHRPITAREACVGIDRTTDTIPPLVTGQRLQLWEETGRGTAHHKRFSTVRLAWSKTSPTIMSSGGQMHPDEPRELSLSEMKRLTSFPDEFQFAGSWNAAQARIGNSVPPLLMRAIASHVRQILEGEHAKA